MAWGWTLASATPMRTPSPMYRASTWTSSSALESGSGGSSAPNRARACSCPPVDRVEYTQRLLERFGSDAQLVPEGMIEPEAVRAAPSRQRYAAVQAEQRLPVGRLVLDDDLDVAHRRTQIGRQGARRVVNRLVERIIETRLRTRIHLGNGARIGAGIAAASSWGLCGGGPRHLQSWPHCG